MGETRAVLSEVVKVVIINWHKSQTIRTDFLKTSCLFNNHKDNV